MTEPQLLAPGHRATRAIAILITIIFTGCTTTTPATTKPMLDLKITNGRILDGTGAPWFRGDVGVRGDTIVAIGNLSAMEAALTIDAADRIVSPGFIDLLSQDEGSVLSDPRVEAKVRQGVTTCFTGENRSPGPQREASPERPWRTLGEFMTHLERNRSAVNFGFFVGAANARLIVLGDTNVQPTADQMRQMEAVIDQAMRDGAFGLSTSLIYVPMMYSETEEIVNMARVAAEYEGVYFSHMRDEGDRIDMGLDEAFRIGREAKIPVNIWHLKAAGRANWGRMPHVVARIEEARASGLDVAANVYPYAASSTSLSTLAPNWALEGGYDDFRARLTNPEDRAKIVAALKAAVERRGDKVIYVARIGNPAQAQYQKRFIEDIAREMNLPPEEALIRLYEANENSPAAIYFSMSEDDVRYALKQSWVAVGADSGSPTPAMRAANASIHPRAYGTFARVAGRYSRDEKLFPLEEAVRKMTSLAASRVKLFDRGILREGLKADIIVFDPATIRDVSTYDDPHHFSEGVSHVVVNGRVVLRDGAMTNELPGRVLRGKGYTAK